MRKINSYNGNEKRLVGTIEYIVRWVKDSKNRKIVGVLVELRSECTVNWNIP